MNVLFISTLRFSYRKNLEHVLVFLSVVEVVMVAHFGGRDFCHELAKVLTECQYTLGVPHLICFRAETSEVANMSHTKICVTGNQYQLGLNNFL